MPKKAATPIPHSWGIESWPPDVFPHDPARARYLYRKHRDDLLKAGAVARVGRTVVVFGSRYTRWLERQASRVPDYEIAPNRDQPAA